MCIIQIIPPPPIQYRGTDSSVPGTWLADGSHLNPSPGAAVNIKGCFGYGHGPFRGQCVPMVGLCGGIQRVSPLLSFISEELSGRPTDQN